MYADNFDTLPYPVVGNAVIKQFHIAISKHEIDRLHLLLDNCPLAGANWENTWDDGRFGISRDWLVKAVQEWHYKYDWLVKLVLICSSTKRSPYIEVTTRGAVQLVSSVYDLTRR
jgi:hypothetical protein